MKNVFLLLLAIASNLPGLCQKQPRLYVSGHFNIIKGQQSVQPGLMLTSGLTNNRWKIGLGAGLDYYVMRTVPVVIECRYFTNKQQKGLFFVADGGLNIPALRDEEKNKHYWWMWQSSNSRYKNGYIMEGGVGFQLQDKHSKASAALSLLVSRKTISEVYEDRTYNGVNVHTYDRLITYSLNRTMLRLSVTF